MGGGAAPQAARQRRNTPSRAHPQQGTPPGSREREGESRTPTPHRPPQKKDARYIREGGRYIQKQSLLKILKKKPLHFF